jgi:hypothetical protein
MKKTIIFLLILIPSFLVAQKGRYDRDFSSNDDIEITWETIFGAIITGVIVLIVIYIIKKVKQTKQWFSPEAKSTRADNKIPVIIESQLELIVTLGPGGLDATSVTVSEINGDKLLTSTKYQIYALDIQMRKRYWTILVHSNHEQGKHLEILVDGKAGVASIRNIQLKGKDTITHYSHKYSF